MEEFQRGEAQTYAAHVKAGVDAFVKSEEGAVLVFSG
jgi:hypothetical protein